MNSELSLLSKVVSDTNPIKALSEVVNSCGQDAFLLHGDVYKYIVDHNGSHSKVPDITTLKEKFPNEVFPVPVEPLSFYIDEVKKAYLYSELSRINSDVLVKNLKANDPVKGLQELASSISKISNMRRMSQDVDLTKNIQSRIDRYAFRRSQGTVSGVPTGWSKLDQELTGFQKGEMTYIVARMGAFKTWTLIDWMCASWNAGFVPLVFSKEMPEAQFSRRIDTYITRTRFKDIKTGVINDEDFDTFAQKMRDTYNNKHSFVVVDTSGVSNYDVDFVYSKIQQYRPDAVWIDGVYLLNPVDKATAFWEKHTNISRDMKQLALVSDLPIIGTLQSNRGAAGKKATIGTQNVAYSDAYSQDADNMIALNRVYDKMSESFSNRVKVEIIKGREAEPVKMFIEVDLDSMKMEETYSSQNPGDDAFTEGFDSPDLDDDDDMTTII